MLTFTGEDDGCPGDTPSCCRSNIKTDFVIFSLSTIISLKNVLVNGRINEQGPKYKSFFAGVIICTSGYLSVQMLMDAVSECDGCQPPVRTRPVLLLCPDPNLDPELITREANLQF